MIDFRRAARKYRTFVVFIVLLLSASIMLAVTGERDFGNPLKAGQSLFSAVQLVFSKVFRFIGDSISSIGKLRDLRREYDDLQEKMKEYELTARDVEELRRENMLLRDQLDFSKKIAYKNISAQIIASSPDNHFSEITLDKGAIHGIKIGCAVIAFQDGIYGLAGKIISVGLISSIMRPLYDLNSFVAARFQTSRFEGLIQGDGIITRTLSMRYVNILAQDQLAFNDYVVTSGYNSLYPSGLYIGRMKSIKPRQWESSLDIEVHPILDFSRIEYVSVLLPPDATVGEE